MEIIVPLLTVLGLSLFEVISSIDNAIINAEVLSGMGKRARRWFLLWGMLFAVFVVRGLLPFLILWLVVPNLGIGGLIGAVFSNDPHVAKTLEESSHFLLLGGGVFLLFLFFHWLFLEQKHFGFIGERFFYSQGVWFYAIVSILLAVIVWFSIQQNPLLAFSAVIGSTAFFITHGFKQQAEMAEQKLLKSNLSDVSKIMYLEVIDTTFSIDGVLGSFAFTLFIPLILLGNGLGAIVLRQLTISNIERIKKYLYLKNGAMYSILFLGSIMILDAFGANIPQWISPVITVVVVTYFYVKSK
ncbi:MAG: DUF475 domain-containing protein [Candidatus Roizmanbacteria bacterium]|nr:MAG: DUF475 domain-containing protein [Candidatus Roizmanbacteria bacterium]